MHSFFKRSLAAVIAATGLILTSGVAQAEEKASRIVVLGGAFTEIIYALGEEKRIRGVDTTSLYPPQTMKIEKVGYFRRISAEGVLSLEPDLIIADAGAGPIAALDQLQAAGVTIATGPKLYGFPGILAKVRFVGEALGVEAKAEQLAEKLAAKMATAEENIARVSEGKPAPRVVVVLSGQSGGLIAAGRKTAADAMLSLVGAENPAAGYDGYKPFSMEAAVAAAPEAIVIPNHAVEALGGVDALLERPEIRATPVGASRRVIVIDGLLLLGFGPRTPDAVEQLAAELYGD